MYNIFIIIIFLFFKQLLMLICIYVYDLKNNFKYFKTEYKK